MSGVSGVTRASLSMARTAAGAAVCRAKLRVGTLAALAALVAVAALLLSTVRVDAQSSSTLVSNIGQAEGPLYMNLGSYDAAQAFVTGSNPTGYRLTAMRARLRLFQGHNTTGLTAKVCRASTNAGGNVTGVDTANCLGTLSTTTPAATTTTIQINHSFSAGAAGINLNAGTTYFVYILDSGSVVNKVQWVPTASASLEDGAAGWSIPSGYYRYDRATQHWGTITNATLRFALDGYAKAAARTGPPNPDPSNLARGAVQWDPVGAMHGLPTRMAEINSNKPSEPTGSVDLTNIAASVSEEREPYSRGYYLTTQVFGLGERSHLVRAGPDGSRFVVDEDGQRYEVVSPGSLLLVKIWHIYYRSESGHNSIELLGDTFYPRLDNRLTEPVEVCVPSPVRDVERVRIAVKGRLDPHWTILDAELRDGQVCAETVRVAWLTLVYAPEPAAA